MNDWERMRAGKLYNADSRAIAKYHETGMGLCDKFNRTPLWMKKRKQRLLEKMIPSVKEGGTEVFAPFYCEYAKPIKIGDGSWGCSSATICGGVTIGKNCIIAAGAVVNSNIPDNCIAAGIPAKVPRKLDEQDRMNVWETYMKNETPLSQRKKGKL